MAKYFDEQKWREELRYNDKVVSFLSYLQTKYKTTKIVVTNQAGVARGLFDCKRVEEINSCINNELAGKGIKIDDCRFRFPEEQNSAYS